MTNTWLLVAAVALCAIAVWVVVPPFHVSLLPFAVGAPELSPWFLLLSLAVCAMAVRSRAVCDRRIRSPDDAGAWRGLRGSDSDLDAGDPATARVVRRRLRAGDRACGRPRPTKHRVCTTERRRADARCVSPLDPG